MPVFEKLLHAVVKQKDITSYSSKFIPPNFSYPNPSFRIAKTDKLTINANIHDYNDWKAYWEVKEIERLNLYSLAQNCTTVVDVGVNNGWVIMNLALIVKPNHGFVYGFEPHPETYARCIRNIAENNIANAKVFNLGCGDEAAQLNMIKPVESNSGQNRVIINDEGLEQNEIVSIKIVKLDEQLKASEKIDLIKIDVEGFEMKVLSGAKEILKKFKPILFIELDDQLLKCNGNSAEELLSFIKSYDYSVLKANTKKELPLDIDLNNCHFDIICQ